jgi:hypothetical protein
MLRGLHRPLVTGAALGALGVVVYTHPVEKLPQGPAAHTLLAKHTPDKYSDCFTITVPSRISLQQYVQAFFTCPVFRVERMLLPVATSDSEAEAISRGTSGRFGVWSVLERTDDELLATWSVDGYSMHGATWFRVIEVPGDATRLEFGSSVTPSEGLWLLPMMWFHVWYSRVLLRCTANNLA